MQQRWLLDDWVVLCTMQQNIVVERKNMTLLGMPILLWGDVVLSAANVLNRMPFELVKIFTPYELCLAMWQLWGTCGHKIRCHTCTLDPHMKLVPRVRDTFRKSKGYIFLAIVKLALSRARITICRFFRRVFHAKYGILWDFGECCHFQKNNTLKSTYWKV